MNTPKWMKNVLAFLAVLVLCVAIALMLGACDSMPVTSAHLKEQIAALTAQTEVTIEQRIAAGENAELVMASEFAALKRAVLDLVAASAAAGVEEATGDWTETPVDNKTGAVALAAMWLLRNWRYFKAGGVPGLLLGGLSQAGAHKPTTKEAK